MDRYGLLGKGVTLSLSKKIHEEAAKILNLKISYEILEVPSEGKLLGYLDELKSGLWKGFNITTPYKSVVVPHLEGVKSFSINTVWSENGKIFGTSTDGLGFEKGLTFLNDLLSQTDGNPSFRSIYSGDKLEKSHKFRLAFLGSGGAVIGILEYLSSIKSEAIKYPISVLVRNLNSESVERLEDFSKKNSLIISIKSNPTEFCREITDIVSKHGSNTFILVNAIPGRGSHYWDAENIFSQIPRSAVFYDLTYPPILSDFYNLALNHFRVCINGLPMLIEQARHSQRIWWGQSPSFEGLFKKII